MADSFTPKLNLTKPEVGASTDTWGTKINTDLDTIDGLFDTGPYVKLSAGGTGAGTAAGARTNLGLGDLATKSAITSADITNGTIVYADLQNVSATSRVLGRKTSGAGTTEELTLSDVLDFVGSAAQGDILYRGASSWARLGAGTSGQFLTSGGAAANPSWTSPSTSLEYIVFDESIGTGTSYEKTSTTITGTYKKIEVILSGISQNSGSNRALQIEIGNSSGSYVSAITVSGNVNSNSVSGTVTIHNCSLTSGTRLIQAGTGQDETNGNCYFNSDTTGAVTGIVNKLKLSWGTSTAFSGGKVTIIGYP